MAGVSSVGGSNPAPESEARLPTKGVDVGEVSQLENNFISLMVAQIQYQDPTSPVDSSQFLNQYSAMSQVKSMQNMTTLAQSNLVLTDNLQTLSAASLVGKEVKASVESLDLDGSAVSGAVELQHASGTTSMVLTDAAGSETKIALGPCQAGTIDFRIDPQSLGLRPGQYSVKVETDSGESPEVQVVGEVDNVRVSAEGPVLRIHGAGSVPFYRIVEFGNSQSVHPV